MSVDAQRRASSWIDLLYARLAARLAEGANVVRTTDGVDVQGQPQSAGSVTVRVHEGGELLVVRFDRYRACLTAYDDYDRGEVVEDLLQAIPLLLSGTFTYLPKLGIVGRWLYGDRIACELANGRSVVFQSKN